jgi:rod shape-determining protein MreD
VRPGDYVPLGRREERPRGAWMAPLTTIIGSLVTILPMVATVPFLPPFGLLMLLAWRLLRPNVLAPWAPVLLGLFDDLVSGQPIGSAMLLWTFCFLVVDVIDTRLVWRDFWQDWLIAAGAFGFCLIAGRLIASPLGAHVDTALLLQIIMCAALFPLVTRLCARLDPDPNRP